MSALPQEVSVTTQPLSFAYRPDAGPARYRIGLIALDSDVATERDFHNMMPDDAMYYTTRIQHYNPVNLENLRRMAGELTAATEKLIPNQRLGSIAYSCTSGTVAIGYEDVAERIRAGGRPDIPVVTPITSAIAAFRKLGVESVSLLTPYVDSVNQAMRAYIEERGVAVRNIGSFCLDSDIDMAEVPSEAILQAAIETCRKDVDALFISCTALRAVDIIERAERALGKPVMSAIQTLFWQSLREAGCPSPVEGYGRLLRV